MQYLIRLIKRTYQMVDPNEGKAVMSNVAFLSGLQAVTYILPIIVLPYLFRVIGPAQFGLIAFAQAFVQYFMIITDYGFSITATKEISINQHEHTKVCEIFSSVMIVKLTFALLSFLVLLVLISVIPKLNADWPVFVLSFGAVIGNTFFPVWFFQGTEKMKYIAILNIIGEIIFVCCIFIMVKEPADYIMVPIITSFVALTTGLLGQYVIFRHFGVTFKFPGYHSLHQQIKAGWNLFISIVAINAYTSTRIFAVGLMTNNTITGFYSIADRIANAVQTFPLSSFTQAIFPRMSKIYQKNKTTAYKLMLEIQQITNIIALIFIPITYLLAPLIIRIICGGNYPAAIITLQLLLISIFFISANAFRIQYLLVSGHTQQYSRIHVSMALLGLPLIIFFISRFSYAGAALATVIIEGGIFTLTYTAIERLKSKIS